MSFRGVYAVIDAWQRASNLCAETTTWRLLLWMARNADDKTLTVIRAQARLGAELATSDRTVRTGIHHWVSVGVLQVLEHGGGRARKPSRYLINLEALRLHALRCMKHPTPEAHTVPELGPSDATRKSRTSGVTDPTPEVHTLPEFNSDVPTSGVAGQLRKFEGGFTSNSGSPGLPGIHRSSEKRRSEVVSSHGLTPSLGHPLARSPEGRLTGASDSQLTEEDRAAVRKLLDADVSSVDVVRFLKARGVTVQQVEAMRTSR